MQVFEFRDITYIDHKALKVQSEYFADGENLYRKDLGSGVYQQYINSEWIDGNYDDLYFYKVSILKTKTTTSVPVDCFIVATQFGHKSAPFCNQFLTYANIKQLDYDSGDNNLDHILKAIKKLDVKVEVIEAQIVKCDLIKYFCKERNMEAYMEVTPMMVLEMQYNHYIQYGRKKIFMKFEI